VYENWIGQRRRKGRIAQFRVQVPRQVPLREVYRLAVRVWNQNSNAVQDIVVQDLGFESVNQGRFWWLFSIKFEWLKPSTWFREPRFLNPMQSIVANDLKPNDIIRAQRMAFINADLDDDDDDIPMGEL
jgi:hypothetical protein